MSGQEGLEGRIAVIGMAGRFPGADSTRAFWDNLCAGVESVRFFTDDELDDWFDPAVRGAANFVKAKPILDGVDQFDAGFFGMQAKEAELTDPQQRVFLECAWQALEDAGYDPATYSGAVGVFAGCSMNTYFLNNVCRDRRTIEEFTSNFQVGAYATLLGAGREFLATRVWYKLGLTGPSVTVQTACSTSLVAISQACQSLLLYQSDMVLAGGVSISFPQQRGYLHQEGGMVSADGRCRPFDADASGTIFGSGAGVVLLKRLDEALADRDHIYAVILGCGVTNDGATKVGFTAPSVDGQAAAIEQALAQAGLDARGIGYVECHGTATPLGDPIEIAALTKAFRRTTSDRQYCAIGSLKGNIGHLDAAAGVAGLIKASLMLEHDRIVPSLHFRQPNPQIDFAGSPFFVAAEATEWPRIAQPRRAGVSSLGVGGTNAHVVLEEAPISLAAPDVVRPELLLLSARSPAALAQMGPRMAEHLRTQEVPPLADIAFTLQQGRRHFAHRSARVCRDGADAVGLLGEAASPRIVSGEAASDEPQVVFMFPGQGSQYPGMAAGLYRRFAVFRAEIDRCAAVLTAHGIDLVDVLYGAEAANAEQLALTGTAQPAIFSVEYALARLWSSWGVKATAFIGHSVGEFVAACLSGVFSLEAALGLVARRGRLMQELPRGGMTGVRLSEAAIAPFLSPSVSLAAVNGPSNCVLAGPVEALADVESQLDAQGIAHRRLHTSHAFHSAMMEPMIRPLADHAQRIAMTAPQIPFVSCVTGDWVRPDEATSPTYWARHAREPVHFAAGVRTLTATTSPLLLEVGPGNTLTTLALQTSRASAGRAIASLPDATALPSDDECILSALGKLWVHGVDPDWRAVADGPRRRVPLPTYPFERRRYWIEPPARSGVVSAPATHDTALPAPPRPATNEPSMTLTTAAKMPPKTADDDAFRTTILAVLEDVSGESVASAAGSTTFLEMGFDSLSLSQVAQRLQSRLKVKIAFRQLLGELSTIDTLEDFIRKHAPAAVPTAVPAAPTAPATIDGPLVPVAAVGESVSAVTGLMRAQVEAMSDLIRKQIDTLQRMGAPTDDAPAAPAPAPQTVVAAAEAPATAPAPSRFQAYRPVQKRSDSGLTPGQRRHIDELTARLTAKTAGSKQTTAKYRPVLADPRACAGFRPEWKELVYPIVAVRAHQARIWDIDGNEYIDLVNGYGPTAFGHSPDFVTEAVREQLDKGFAIGPQAEYAGEVATLFAEMTGNERMTFCNTGSEAVMAAMRVARTVTGRDKVVMFSGAYHGQFDEVLVRAAGRSGGAPRSVPAAVGIPDSAVQNVVVLDYATPQSLQWIKDNADDLAAVIVEPVQSRHPDLQPFDFLRALREITAAAGIVFVMDEIVTGFRVHPGGMQAVTGIRADLATYGKVLGGGMPIGILAGKAEFMDALDGGAWNYGDDSVPEVGVTFFAGTFVRHPLTLAAVRAVLKHLKAHGTSLQDQVARRAAGLADTLNNLFRFHGLAAKVECYSSFIYFNLHAEDPLAPLLFYHLRDRGIHIQDGFPLFITTAHTDDDIAKISAAFADSFKEMVGAGILAAAASRSEAVETPTVTPRSVPLTESQIEIWLAAQMGDDASSAFNESVTLRLTGPLDEPALAAALARVVARHDALRARFTPTGEAMVIADDSAFSYATTDAAADAGRSAEAVLAAYVEDDARTPFDLVGGSPVRAHLLKLSPVSHALVVTAHHIVCDGWSINVVIGELAETYAALREGRDAELPPLLSFSDYAAAQAQRGAAERAPIEAYWMAQYETPAQPIDLPTDRPRPAVKTYGGATRCRRIDAGLYKAVKAAGARHGCTLFVTLLAAFEALMGRLAGVEAVVIGVPTAGQSLIEDQVLVGHCVNFLPIRGGWRDDTSFADHLRMVGKQVLDAYEHQDITLGTIVRKLSLPREPNRLPLTELQFNLERLTDKLHCAGIDIAVEPNAKAHVNFDLFWNVIESQDGLRIDCDYNADLFDAVSIDHWLECYAALLQAIATDTGPTVSQMSCIPPADVRRMVIDLNATTQDYPRDRCVHMLIEKTAAERPDATAVLFRGAPLSYRELDNRSNRLAQHLHAMIGRPGARVGVLIERSPEMLVALLAVWKAGCAYVPLDPDHPIGRLKQILSDADVSALLTDAVRSDLQLGSDTPIIDVQAERQTIAGRPTTPPVLAEDPEATAYLIYTSGSTGAPKGVEVSHRSLSNLLHSIARRPGIAAADTLLAITTVSFDIAALELFVPLLVGGTVAMAERRDVTDAHRLLARLNETAASVMQATPASWHMLLEAGFRSRSDLKMLCGGEALSRELADRLLEGGGRLWNMYGPTETTVWSSCAEISADDAPIVIGPPIANTQLHVLDRQHQPVPYGVLGELCIGGDGVAKGYFRRSDLTTEKFIADPFGLSSRLYRTGDVARRHSSGEIQVLGRADLQVKLRGFRIELGEIEAALSRRAGLAAAAVALRDDVQGRPLLVGYVVEYPGHPRSDEELRARVADELPDYMVPALWVRLDRLPVSPNGKLDRAALPAPDRPVLPAGSFSPPQTALEATLASIWAEVLGVERVGREDELFRLGADSIQLFQIAARANRQQIKLSVRQLLNHQTVAALATALTGQNYAAAADNNATTRTAISLRDFQKSRHDGTSG